MVTRRNRRSAPTLRAALALVISCTVGGADAAQPGDLERALARGEILVDSRAASGTPEVVVRAVIDAAPKRVWELVSHCARYPSTMPRIKAAREVSRQGKVVVCRVTVDMPFPYSDLTAVTRAIHETSDGRYSRRWELIEGDYRVNRGAWELAPFRGDPGRTLAVYRVQALPKAWIPAWVREKAQRRSLPEMMRNLRRLVR